MSSPQSNQSSLAVAPALERKLVTLRQITQIRRPCRLHLKRMMLVTVADRWDVIIKNREYKIGDTILFFEDDSFIPATAVNFGRDMRGLLGELDGERGYHVQSRTVSNIECQGHVMSIEDFPYVRHIVDIMKEEYGPVEGLRVASMMAFEGVIGVKMWEAPNEPNAA